MARAARKGDSWTSRSEPSRERSHRARRVGRRGSGARRDADRLVRATFATLAALIELTAEGFEPTDPKVTAIVFWVFGVLWALAADRALLHPLRTGVVVGTLTAIIAPCAIATARFDLTQTTMTLAAVWSFATSAIALTFGAVRGDRAVQGIAIAGIIV